VPAAGAEARFPPGASPRLSHPTACGHHLAYTHRRRCQDTNVLSPPCYHNQRAAFIVGFAVVSPPGNTVREAQNYTLAARHDVLSKRVPREGTGRTSLI
jgi:hypothetical protein